MSVGVVQFCFALTGMTPVKWLVTHALLGPNYTLLFVLVSDL